MKSRVFFVDPSSKEKIDALRMREYATAQGFRVDPESLRWRASDDESYVLAAEIEGQIVATMRAEVIESLALLERKLECPWNFSLELEMPVLLLSRAATHGGQRSLGLNLILRYWFLRMAQAQGIRFILGTFIAGSSRERSLRAMGYQFFENSRGWQQSTYRSLNTVQVVALDLLQHGEQAIRYCEQRTKENLTAFSLENGFPELRFTRSL